MIRRRTGDRDIKITLKGKERREKKIYMDGLLEEREKRNALKRGKRRKKERIEEKKQMREE